MTPAKTIIWDTNFNGKLACDRFVHVDLAPEKNVTAEMLNKTIIKIQTADRSHDPVLVKLDTIIPFRVGELSNVHTWPSHGMNTADYLHWQHLKTPIRHDTNLAVYYYKKIAI